MRSKTGYLRVFCIAAFILAFSLLSSCSATVIEKPKEYDLIDPSTVFTPEKSPSKPDIPKEEYVSPVDFDALHEINPDIYAWIEITDTDISYPVLHRAGDNAFYLEHDSSANYDPQGCLFTEDYNSADFSDPVTVIYGHNTTWNDILFGSLEKKYTDREFFDAHRELHIYLEDCEYKYNIFAATPYSNVHLLYYYDFSKDYVFDEVINDITNQRTLQTVVYDDADITSADDILVLSTCLKSHDKTKRFLVLAVKEQ